MKKYENPENFWNTPQGREILQEERENTFGGDPSAVSMETVERIWKKYRDLIKSTESKL